MNTEQKYTEIMKRRERFKFATMIGYSDRQAFEVIRHVSDKCIMVRRMEAKLLNGVNSGEPDALKFEPGGFCGHTSGTQRYEFTSNEANRVIRIRLHKDGRWYDRAKQRYTLDERPYEHYDFNY